MEVNKSKFLKLRVSAFSDHQAEQGEHTSKVQIK